MNNNKLNNLDFFIVRSQMSFPTGATTSQKELNNTNTNPKTITNTNNNINSTVNQNSTRNHATNNFISKSNTNFTHKSPPKKISFSSLNIDNNSFSNFINMSKAKNKDYLNSNRNSILLADSSNDKFNKSQNSITRLSTLFVEERNASVNCKTDLHKKILDIGENLHESILRKLRKEHEKKLKLKEIEMSEYFKNELENRIEQERNKFASKLESIKLQLKNDYERLLREKTVEIEIYNQNIAKEQIELYKAEAKKNLESTIEKIEDQHELDKKLAIEKALENHKKSTETLLEEQRKTYDVKIDDLNENWLNKLDLSMQDLRQRMNKDYEKSIGLKYEQIRCEKDQEIEELKDMYERKLDKSRLECHQKVDEISQLNAKINSLNYEKQQLKVLIDELRQEFQNCIEHFSHLKKKEGDYLFTISDNLREKLKI